MNNTRKNRHGEKFQLALSSKKFELKSLLSIVLFVAALLFLIDGFYINAKAKYAQYLIADSWRHYMQTGEQKKPWPWADTYPVAKLEMYHNTQYVLAGASGRNLAFGPTHMLQTAALGSQGNAVVVGHRDTHFEVLKHAKEGDLIYVTSRNPVYSKEVITSNTPYISSPPYQPGLSDRDASKTISVANPYLKQAYRISSIEIVSEYNLNVLKSNRNDTSITLITCYPFDSISPKPSLRYVVKAKKI